MTKIQNKAAEVENKNLTELVKNKVVTNSTQQIFEAIMNLENIENLAELIATNMSVELMHASFMSEQLELTEKQKEKLLGCMKVISDRSKNQYLTNIKTDKRTEKIIENLVVYSEVQRLKEENQGEYYRWLPSGADEPDPEHQLLYGETFQESIRIEEKNEASNYDLETGEVKNDESN